MCVWCCDARWCIVTCYLLYRSLPASCFSSLARSRRSGFFLFSFFYSSSSQQQRSGRRRTPRTADGAPPPERRRRKTGREGRTEEASPSRRRRRRAAGRGPGLALPFSSSLLPSLSLPPILSSQLGLRHEIACPSESLYIPVAVNRTVTNCS